MSWERGSNRQKRECTKASGPEGLMRYSNKEGLYFGKADLGVCEGRDVDMGAGNWKGMHGFLV